MEGELYNVQEGLEGELGYKGERGYSTYELAVLNGFEGTIQDYLDHYGVDLTGYIKTSDVVDDLTSTSTSYPLSANQGKALKTLVDGLDTSKADASTTYIKTQVDTMLENVNTMLENINGKVLWVNPSPSNSFSSQTIQLDLSNYDEVEIFYRINGTTMLDSLKLIKYTFNNLTWKTKTCWNGMIGTNAEFNTSNNNASLHGEGRQTEWVDDGIQFGTGNQVGHSIITSNNEVSSFGRTSDYDCIPVFIIGRYRGIYNLDSIGGE